MLLLICSLKTNGEFLHRAEELCQKYQLAHISVGIRGLGQTGGPSRPVLPLAETSGGRVGKK